MVMSLPLISGPLSVMVLFAFCAKRERGMIAGVTRTEDSAWMVMSPAFVGSSAYA